MQVVWTARALRNLSSLRAYIAQDRPVAAERQVERVLVAAVRLAQFPESGRPGRRVGTRELVMSRTPYLVPYRVLGASWSRCCASCTGGSGRTRSEAGRAMETERALIQLPLQRSQSRRPFKRDPERR
jgi:toxin ParE1/3/4